MKYVRKLIGRQDGLNNALHLEKKIHKKIKILFYSKILKINLRPLSCW